ncbi:MAG: biotin/lipoyl-containing protein [Pseudomonadota bacterium]
MPDIGEGVAEGEIVNWLVQAGDDVTENQEMVEVMTDKATVTIGAPKAGKVSELRFKVGETVPVGQVLVVFETGGGEAPAAAPPAAPAAAAPPPAASAPAPAAKSEGPVASAVGRHPRILARHGSSRRQERGRLLRRQAAGRARHAQARA